MATKRGGKKRSDKPKGRRKNTSLEKFAKLAAGMSNTASGEWKPINSVNLDNKMDGMAKEITERCSRNSARNESSRARRGTVTGRGKHKA